MIPVEAISELSIKLNETIEQFPMDSTIHRFGKNNVCWGIAYDNITFCTVCVGRWDTGEKYYWNSNKKELSEKEKKEWLVKKTQLDQKIEKQKKDIAQKAKYKANKTYDGLAYSKITHEYLAQKKISSNYNAKITNNNSLFIPALNEQLEIVGGQYIRPDGTKKFIAGSKLDGSFFLVGTETLTRLQKLYICEGYATACTIHEATLEPVLGCFSAHNIPNVLSSVKSIPSVIVCADNDDYTYIKGKKVNVGLRSAMEAKKQVERLEIKLPFFRFESIEKKPTDFNDLHCIEGIEEVRRQLTEKFDIDGFYFGYTKIEEKEKGKDDKKVKYIRLYERLRKHYEKLYSYKCVGERNCVFLFNGKRYRKTNDIEIKCFAQKSFYPSLTRESEAVEFMQRVKRFGYSSSDFFTKDTTGLVNFNNGVFDMNTKEFLPHSPKYPFQSVLTYDYEESQKGCPTYEKFLENITNNRLDLINILEEYIAYIISNYSYEDLQCMLILSGSGLNGKSTFLSFLERFIGVHNCTSVPIDSIAKEPYALAQLEGKLVNFCEEESVKSFRDTSNLKRLTGGTRVNARNPYERPFTFINRAKIIVTYNEMPFLGDTTKGMLRRLLIVPFSLDLDKEPNKKIFDIQKKLKQERSAIFRRIVVAYDRLRQKGFTTSNIVDEEKDEIHYDSNPFDAWFRDYVVITANELDRLSVQEMYDHYVGEVESGKEDKWKLSKRIFIKRVKQKTKKYNFEYKTIRFDNSISKGFSGLRLLHSIE